jgi:2-polyprenyl-6-methoxyphenol hydroxylase-like FAD-dependent oxidoreductase
MSDTEANGASSTRVVVVGAGPAGAVLGLLLARGGVPVTLLEAHHDFDRDFRGDTVHPSTLEILDQIGLAERLHQLPHAKIAQLRIHTPAEVVTIADASRLRTRFPYIMMLPQVHLLELLTAEARRYPHFRLVLGANVQRLIEDNGAVRGVAYRDADDHWQEVRADLTVAADGRFSKVRHLAGIEPESTAAPMDVVWFRLPRRADDPAESGAIFVGGGRFAVVLQRPEEWQIGYVILKGSFGAVRAAGLPALRAALTEVLPWLGDRVGGLQDWRQVSVLNVESSRVRRWYRPGLLLIGDAAHVMSPVGGVGINYAVQDAVEAANLLVPKLRRGPVTAGDLAAVQRRREWPVRFIQAVQRLLQSRLVAAGLKDGQTFRLPWFLRLLTRLPLLRNLPARIIGFGLRRVRVEVKEAPPLR